MLIKTKIAILIPNLQSAASFLFFLNPQFTLQINKTALISGRKTVEELITIGLIYSIVATCLCSHNGDSAVRGVCSSQQGRTNNICKQKTSIVGIKIIRGGFALNLVTMGITF